MAKSKHSAPDILAEIQQSAQELLDNDVPTPNKQLCLFEDWADWNAEAKQKNPKNNSGLTIHQEIFAQLVAAGYTKTEAYKKAYPNCQTENLNTVYPKACRLAKMGNVGARVEVLRKQLVDNALMSPTELFQRLTKIARGTGKDALDALKQIGQIHGLFKPEKETSVNIGPSLVVQTVDYSNAEPASTGANATGKPENGEVAK